MAKTLDRDRPFGEVWGSESGVRFVQDETEFDAQGNEMSAPKPRKAKAADPVVEDQVAAQLGGEG